MPPASVSCRRVHLWLGTQFIFRTQKLVWMIHFSWPPSNVKDMVIVDAATVAAIIIQGQYWRQLCLLTMKIPNLKDWGKSGP